MKAPAVIILTMGMLLCFWPRARTNPLAEKEAVVAAEAWLELVDAKKYGESWDRAASYFQGAISR